MTVREFVRANYYFGDMDVEEIVATVKMNANESTTQFLAENYYSGDLDDEEIIAGIISLN